MDIFNSSTSLSQNKAIPKITNYYEQVLPTSKNSTFQQHFRLCRPGAEYLLSVIGPRLVSPGVNGRPPVPPEKKDLVMFTYISGSVSLRPLSTTFGSEKVRVAEFTEKCISNCRRDKGFHLFFLPMPENKLLWKSTSAFQELWAP